MNKIKCKDIKAPQSIAWLSFTLDVTIPDMDEPFNVFNSSTFQSFLTTRFADFEFCYRGDFDYAEFWELQSAFNSYFNSMRKKSIAMQIYALLKTYNPIENYDKTSEITTEYKGRKESKTQYDNVKDKTTFNGVETNEIEKIGKEKNETTKSGSEKTEFNNAQLKTTRENSRAPMTSSTYSNLDKNEETTQAHNDIQTTSYGINGVARKDTSVIEYGADNTTRKDTNTTSFLNRYNEHSKTGNEYVTEEFGTGENARKDILTERTHGNIGVTTSAQMVSEILQVYNLNFVESLLDGFFNHYCYLFEVRD